MEQSLIRGFKYEMSILKYIPLILAILLFLYIIITFFQFDLTLISLFGGIGIIPIIFLLLSSHVFKFCIYHRLPIYYVITVHLLCLFDFYIGIPISLYSLLMLHILLFSILLNSIVYFKCKKV